MTRCNLSNLTFQLCVLVRRRVWARFCSLEERKRKGSRLPNSRMMIHQPLGGFSGQASDIDIHAKEILKIREKLNS